MLGSSSKNLTNSNKKKLKSSNQQLRRSPRLKQAANLTTSHGKKAQRSLFPIGNTSSMPHEKRHLESPRVNVETHVSARKFLKSRISLI